MNKEDSKISAAMYDEAKIIAMYVEGWDYESICRILCRDYKMERKNLNTHFVNWCISQFETGRKEYSGGLIEFFKREDAKREPLSYTDDTECTLFSEVKDV